MDFTQTAPTLAEGVDGTVVELVDKHHAKLVGPAGTWLVDLKPAHDDDWLTVEVDPGSIRRSSVRSEGGDSDRALAHLVAGLRALRVRVRLEQDDPGDGQVRWV